MRIEESNDDDVEYIYEPERGECVICGNQNLRSEEGELIEEYDETGEPCDAYFDGTGEEFEDLCSYHAHVAHKERDR